MNYCVLISKLSELMGDEFMQSVSSITLKTALRQLGTELRNCVKVEVDVLGSLPSVPDSPYGPSGCKVSKHGV